MRFMKRLWVKMVRAFGMGIYITESVGDIPDRTANRILYHVGEGGYTWYAVMRCPCGCGELLQLNTTPGARPRWDVNVHDDGTVTLYPSVWRKVGCRSHFFLRNGKIIWCDLSRTQE